MLGVTCDGPASHPRGSSNTPSCFMVRPVEPLDSEKGLAFSVKYLFTHLVGYGTSLPPVLDGSQGHLDFSRTTGHQV